MEEPLVVTPKDPILQTLPFKAFRNIVERRVVPFLPARNEPQTIDIDTPWGVTLTAKRGDFILSEMDQPEDCWPVAAEIFEDSYLIIRPGVCVKNVVTLLVPLVELTGGDEDRQVSVVTLEGSDVVRAGDFYLAKGVKGEIWPYPKEKVAEVMRPVE
jgi:hypothetical protein